MKKTIFYILISLSAIEQSFACSWDDDWIDNYYYNLFQQEIIDSPQYYPFLRTNFPYYNNSDNDTLKNDNIEEWQTHLKLNYEDAEYLVFVASRDDVQKLIDGKSLDNERLKFATATWIAKHKQALRYIAYAKYLEPYMSISDTDNWYYNEYAKKHSVAELDYADVLNVLKKSWKAEKDKELKLRYGYQMVRLAHYSKKYADAVSYFSDYVEVLKYKPAMYYYALDQMAGAQRGLEQTDDANFNFLTVFAHSNSLKQSALTSIRFSHDADFDTFLQKSQSTDEINDAYLLLGFMSFSDPLAAAGKIVASTPDAIQAKLLIARAVNDIERIYNLKYLSADDICNDTDKRYPIICAEHRENAESFFQRTLTFVQLMANKSSVREKNFWNLTTSYLQFLNKDFTTAKLYLDKVDTSNAKYKNQKTNLSMYIDICEQPSITSAVETELYGKYKDEIVADEFVTDVLANRYFLQKDYAKSFLLNNNISELENNTDMELLAAVEAFYQKPNKNAMETFIAQKGNNVTYIQEYFYYLWGNIYLAKGDLEKSYQAFKNTNHYDIDISNNIFAYNRIECFNCAEDEVMKHDYISDFPFIKDTMNIEEMVEALLQLQKTGQKNSTIASKANYLIGNFFYNVSRTGYYRYILRFANSVKFEYNKKSDIYGGIYLKFNRYSYPHYYENQTSIAFDYLQKAYAQATDNELKARIAFALSKCEQEEFYDENEVSYLWYSSKDNVMISNRKYFAELYKYKKTSFYEEVKTNCKYFEYYVSLMK
ncbi:MAG: hypothetical protein LBV75_03805 [Paludibacter sp.]|jgi:hypothetical protein|nr:hypothetical protein [Paludibacter sp.]